MKKILIIVQARYGSTRLPGKVMMKIKDKPLLWYVIKRLELVKIPSKIIIATTDSSENKPILDLAEKMGLDRYCGDEFDVLDRYYQATKRFKGNIIVRITSDCPLIDPSIIERGIQIFFENKYDYVSNVDPPTFPDGYDVEIFSFDALEKAWRDANLKSQREHVTPFIRENKGKFKTFNFTNDVDVSKIRLTVDTEEDFVLISKIISVFESKWELFSLKDVLKYLESNPDLLKINEQYERNEGYLKSLREDKKL